MRKRSVWRFVLKIVGASLAAAGLICLIVGGWDRLAQGGSSVRSALRRRSEYDDYDDEAFFCE